MAKKKTKSITLDENLLEWYDKQENASEEIRKAIRIYKMLKEELNSDEIQFRTKKAVKYYKEIEKEFDKKLGINMEKSKNKSANNKSKTEKTKGNKEVKYEEDPLEKKLDNI